MSKANILSVFLILGLCSFTIEDYNIVAEERILYDFEDQQQRRTWFQLNDDIMGGVSSSKFTFNDKTLTFSGKVSLENRGGFASIRSKTNAMNLYKAKKFKLRVKGDGKAYYFNISSSNFIADPGFQARFTTEKDKWQDIELSLDDFSPAFGSRSSKKDLDMSKIKIMGLIISDKQAGKFNLEIDWIKSLS